MVTTTAARHSESVGRLPYGSRFTPSWRRGVFESGCFGMQDGLVSVSKIVAVALWGATLGLLVVAWVAWLLADSQTHLAILMAETACILSAVAAVAQIRLYVMTICAHLRALRAQDGTVGFPPRGL